MLQLCNFLLAPNIRLFACDIVSLADDATLPQGWALAPKLLAELRLAENFIDLVVRVLHINDSDEPTRMIIWDGSGSAAESNRTLVCTLKDHGVPVPPNGMLQEVIMSSCWTVVRDMGFIDGLLTHWCRFRNLAVGNDEPIPAGTASASEGREILRFREVTSLVLVPDFALDVKLRLSQTNRSSLRCMPGIATSGGVCQPQERHDEVPAGTNPLKVTTVIPDHIKEKVPLTPLREILRSAKAPRKFHCCGRVRNIWPTDIAKICKLKPGSQCEYIYSFAFTVEEGADSLNIIVYGKDAVSVLSYLFSYAIVLLTWLCCW
ncbi:unnamed protein product [Phytophthora fragariaefolia]|uniref:Unnamed protein product n=1 Tax=Phytophthora fragariaefolia TaxID=1490495 RepID=A0A9W6XFU5_9STRA|nr:unnamed protein product [Phytophthora fragariaefolia]